MGLFIQKVLFIDCSVFTNLLTLMIIELGLDFLGSTFDLFNSPIFYTNYEVSKKKKLLIQHYFLHLRNIGTSQPLFL